MTLAKIAEYAPGLFEPFWFASVFAGGSLALVFVLAFVDAFRRSWVALREAARVRADVERMRSEFREQLSRGFGPQL